MKAFDSINRSEMIEVLQSFRIHPLVINAIANLYINDKTNLYLNEKKIVEIVITSGIRQGCNLSALLFVLITYKIIDKINDLGYGFCDEIHKISSLFYMDDALIFTHSLEEMNQLISRLVNISIKFGLKLNKDKCRILIFKSRS